MASAWRHVNAEVTPQLITRKLLMNPQGRNAPICIRAPQSKRARFLATILIPCCIGGLVVTSFVAEKPVAMALLYIGFASWLTYLVWREFSENHRYVQIDPESGTVTEVNPAFLRKPRINVFDARQFTSIVSFHVWGRVRPIRIEMRTNIARRGLVLVCFLPRDHKDPNFDDSQGEPMFSQRVRSEVAQALGIPHIEFLADKVPWWSHVQNKGLAGR